jgi:CRISPR-associated protein Csm3
MTVEFYKLRQVSGVLELRSGLHIGSGKSGVEIGGVDNPVLRHPHSKLPYIPGSSLKGKLRSLLEWALGRVDPMGSPWSGEKEAAFEDLLRDPILRTFGTTRKEWRGGPTRLVVRDAQLQPEWVKRIEQRGLPLTEDKMEVAINRIEGKAHQMGPRTMERVPAGARFGFELSFRQFVVGDDGGRGDLECLNRVFEGLKLLEGDALGGSGSRGYGQIRITGLTVDGQAVQERFDQLGRISLDKAQLVVTE